jgi:regulator of replication initiation timing
MKKYSGAQAAEMMKLAADTTRALSTENQGLRTENQDLKTKVAHFERKERAEKVAAAMEAKGLEPETSIETKIENLMAREDLAVVEQAVELTAPQTKLASVADGVRVSVEGDVDGDAAATQFAANIASIG